LVVDRDEDPVTLTVTAASTADPAKTGTATVTVSNAIATVNTVTISPHTVWMVKGGTQTFTAVVTGTNNPAQAVTWEVQGNTREGTTISAEGVLTVAANESAASLSVCARSIVDTDKSDWVDITMVTVNTVTVSPATATVVRGGATAFTAAVTGTNNPAQTVTWTVAGNTSTGTAISAGGLLTVAADETATSLTITAASTVDTGKSGAATVTVRAATVNTVTVSPATVRV
jgi:hypothetical protein